MRPTEAQRRKFAEMAKEMGKEQDLAHGGPTVRIGYRRLADPAVMDLLGGNRPRLDANQTPGRATDQTTAPRRAEEPYEGYRRFELTLTVVEAEERDRFRGISRPETFFEIRPGRSPGERGAYSVELTYDEYRRALADSRDPEVNLHVIEAVVGGAPTSLTDPPGAAAFAYLDVANPDIEAYSCEGVDVGVIDSGMGVGIRDTRFAGRIKAAKSFRTVSAPLTNPFSEPAEYGGHGSIMSSICAPRLSRLVLGATDYYSDEVAAALYWMTDEIGVHVVNMSFRLDDVAQVVVDALNHAFDQGVILVGTAGNGGVDAEGAGENLIEFPGSHPRVLCMTNYVPSTDAIAFTSNYGNGVWAAAAGSEIYHYDPTGALQYLADGGTSAAAAATTSLIARLISSGSSPSRAVAELAQTARSTGAGQIYEGHGVLQLDEAAAVEPPPEWEEPGWGDPPPLVGTPIGGGPTGGGSPTDTGVQIAQNIGHTLIRKTDGTVWSWGIGNSLMGDGVVRDPSVSDPEPVFFPQQIESLNNVVKISVGPIHQLAAALKSDGTVWVWGELPWSSVSGLSGPEYDGNLELFEYDFPLDWPEGYNYQIFSPSKVAGFENVLDVEVGNSGNLWLILDNGEVWGFGYNPNATLGVGHNNRALNAFEELGISDVKQISTRTSEYFNLGSTAFLKNDGTLWTCGHKTSGNLGLPSGGASLVTTPTQIAIADVTQISMGEEHALALTNDGELWGWGVGSTFLGELTDLYYNVDVYEPVTLEITGVQEIAAGWHKSHFLKTDGTVWGCGDEGQGTLGFEPTNDPVCCGIQAPPLQVELEGAAVSLSRGYWTNAVVLEDCSVWMWGSNFYGILGNGGDADLRDDPSQPFQRYPVEVLGGQEQFPLIAGSALTSGASCIARTPEGDSYVWGENARGRLLLELGDVNNPQSSPDTDVYQAISLGEGHTAYLADDGTVWCAGWNSAGQLGDGTTTDSAVALQVPGLSGVVEVAAGVLHTLALKSDGTVWAWGSDGQGQRGNGTGFTTNTDPPTQVVDAGGNPLSGITRIATGQATSYALDSSGVLWAWGEFTPYMDGATPVFANRHSANPMTGDLSPGGTVTDFATGQEHVVILLADGTVQVASMNSVGQMGQGNNDQPPSGFAVPETVPGLSGVVGISAGKWHCLATLSDGTVRTWGYNAQGQLGDGTTDDRYDPTEIPDFGDVATALGAISHSLFVKNDGTVWTCGDNFHGQIGDHTYTERHSPVQVFLLGDTVDLAACVAWAEPTEPMPGFEPDPILGDPISVPDMNIGEQPDSLPDFGITLPPNIELPSPGDPIEITPPRPPSFPPSAPSPPPMPGIPDQIKPVNPPMDPCNIGMPDMGGGICGPPGGPGDGHKPGHHPGHHPGTPIHGPIIRPPLPRPPGTPPDSGGPGGSKYFKEKKCYNNALVTSIMLELCAMLGLDPDEVIVVGCTERWTGCFAKGSNIFDALRKMAQICGFGVVIPPVDPPVIGPPTPNDVHHYLHEDTNIFVLERVYDNSDLYERVEAFRPPLYQNGVEIKAPVSKEADITSPFIAPVDSTKMIQVTDYNLTDSAIQNIANLEAGKLSGSGAKCQVTTLYDNKYHLYDQIHIQRPSINWFTRWMIRSLNHSFTDEGWLTIIQATWLGADTP